MTRYVVRLLATLIVVIPPAPLVSTPVEPFDLARPQNLGRRALRPSIVPPLTAPITVVPSRTSPLIAVRVAFHVGAAHDPPGKEGLAALTAALILRGGMRGSSFQQTRERLYPIASSIRVECGKESTAFSAVVHRDNFDRLVATLAAMLIMPRFDTEELERLRAGALARLLRQPAVAEDVVQEASGFVEMELFRGHPYGQKTEGDRQSLSSITAGDVARFYREHYTRDALHLGLAGVTAPNFVDTLRSQLGGLPAAPSRRSYRIADVPERAGLDVVIHEAPGHRITLALGFPLREKLGNLDADSLALATTALDARFVPPPAPLVHTTAGPADDHPSWTMGDTVTESEFASRGVPTQSDPRSFSHVCVVWQTDSAERAADSLAGVLSRLREIAREGLSTSTFVALHDTFEADSRLRWLSLADQLTAATYRDFFDKGSGPAVPARAREPLTLESVNLAARRHLRPPGMTVVVIAPHGREVASHFEAASPRLKSGWSSGGEDVSTRAIRIRVATPPSTAAGLTP